MKKLLALLLCTLFCLACTWALAADYTVPGLFTITYDDTVYELDDNSYLSEKADDGFTWLFILYGDDALIDVEAEKLMDFPDLTFLSASEEERQAYVDYFLDSYADEDAELIASLTSTKDGIPFYVFSMQDEDGLYYQAETVVKGYALDFYGYYENREPDDALLEDMKALVESFIPETGN